MLHTGRPITATLLTTTTAAALTLAAAAATPTRAAVAGKIVSDFNDNTPDGWTLTGDATASPAVTDFPYYLPNPPSNPCLLYSAGPDPDGDGSAYFNAPSTFLGDRSAYAGGTLSFGMGISNPGGPAGVVLSSPGGSLFAPLAQNDLSEGLVPYTFPLSTDPAPDGTPGFVAHFSYGAPDGPLATDAQIQSVLADLTSLQIRGRFSPDFANVYLDDVTLAPPAAAGATLPEPTLLLPLLATTAPALLLRRRRTHAN